MTLSTTKLVSDQLITKLKQEYLCKDEQKVLNFLKEKHPNLVSPYLKFITKGRQGILKRLIGSMLREDIMGLASNSYDLYVIGPVHAINVPTIDEYWQKMLHSLQKSDLKGGIIYKLYPLTKSECLVIPVSRTYAFNRVEAEGILLYISEAGVKSIEHATELLELLFSKNIETGQRTWASLSEELINGSANLALAFTYWEQKKKTLQQQAADRGITNSIDWVLDQKKHSLDFDSSLFFEQLTVEGHNLHPGTKTKIGMEPKDVFRYAPEFDGTTDIQFVGIHRNYAEWGVIMENEQDANALLFKEYPALPGAAKHELAKQGLDVNDFVFVPVHSWQLENAIPHIYQQEIKEQIVVPVHGVAVTSGATSSFRTVVPITDGETSKHAIKVAVNSQMTSTVRSISANTANNAAVFTRLIRKVMQKEKRLLKTFMPICESAGFNFKVNEKSGKNKEDVELKSRNLSAVLRENTETFIAKDEVGIVGSSLFAESPISEKRVFVELIEKLAKQKKEASLRKAAFQFVSQYFSVSLPGFLTLMVKYGIGLEGHLQNSIMVFRDGQPLRMLFRDWGGARIYQERLLSHKIDAQFYPGSVTMTNQLKEMHNKVFYTVFQNHCGELIVQVCKHFGLREEELWQEVHQICHNIFSELEIQPLYRENARMDKLALYQPKVDHKALTRMRLEPEGKSYSYATVSNPLSQFVHMEG